MKNRKLAFAYDIGVASIGWVVITYILINNQIKDLKILQHGTKIIPVDNPGKSTTKNQDRTILRSIRTLKRRFLGRVRGLNSAFKDINIVISKSLKHIDRFKLVEIWKESLHNKVTLEEFLRVLIQLNKRRGYNGDEKDDNEIDKEKTDYLKVIRANDLELLDNDIYIGDYHYYGFKKNRFHKIKKKSFSRNMVFREFEKIWETQSQYYPTILTPEFKNKIKNIIFYQRDLKSQKDLISMCPLEGRMTLGKKNQLVPSGSKCSPISTPLSQICRIWEVINTIEIEIDSKIHILTLDEKNILFEHLNNNEYLNLKDCIRILDLKGDKIKWNFASKNGILGNVPRVQMMNCLKDNPDRDNILSFNLEFEKGTEIISNKYMNENFYKLYHLIYSISKIGICKNNILKKFSTITNEQAYELAKLNFTRSGIGNKSNKAICKLIPQLKKGLNYADACKAAGYNHSNYTTKEENEKRILDTFSKMLPKNYLRNPTVSKVTSNLLQLNNLLIEKYGNPDETKIETTRDIRASKEQRLAMSKSNGARSGMREKALKTLTNMFPGKCVTNRMIEKYLLWLEFDGCCIYEPTRGKIPFEEILADYDKEHIIAQAIFLDNSNNNLTLCKREENVYIKASNTGYDYMRRDPKTLKEYVKMVKKAYEDKKISKQKMEYLLTSFKDIEKKFGNRLLNETGYINAVLSSALKKVSRDVIMTKGQITAKLRDVWGYNDIIKILNKEDFNIDGAKKRDDNRHHLLDALVISQTSTSILNKLNNLHTESYEKDGKIIKKEGTINLDKWLYNQTHLSKDEVMEILRNGVISIKPGKRATTLATDKNTGKKVRIPRGSLHQDQPHKMTELYTDKIVDLDSNFKLEYVDLITNDLVKNTVKELLEKNNNDPKKAFEKPVIICSTPIKKVSIKTDKKVSMLTKHYPLSTFIDKYDLEKLKRAKENDGKKKKIKKEEPVKVKSAEDLKKEQEKKEIKRFKFYEDVMSVVDQTDRQALINHFEDNDCDVIKAFGDLEKNPVYKNKKAGVVINRVRMIVTTKVEHDKIVKILVNNKSNGVCYYKYFMNGNNHNISVYFDKESGENVVYSIRYIDAIERNNAGLPTVITDLKSTWDKIRLENITNENLLSKIPDEKLEFVQKYEQNDMFVIGMTKDEVKTDLDSGNIKNIAKKLYRIQKIEKGTIHFRHQYDTKNDDKINPNFENLIRKSPNLCGDYVKVFVNRLGEIELG